MKASALLVLLAGGLLAAPLPDDIDLFIGSTAPGGGTLAVAYDFCFPVLTTAGARADGLVRYTATQPGFNALADPRPGQLYVLRDRLPVEMELTAIDPSLTVKVGTVLLATPGSRALLGLVPDIHLHPEWRLLLPEGVTGDYHLEFRLTTSAAGYRPSPAYRMTVTNRGDASARCTTTTVLPVSVVERLVPGGRLELRSAPANPARRRLRVAIAGDFAHRPEDAPDAAGARLRLLSNAEQSFEGRYELPAARWRPVRSRGALRGYRYRDRRGPIRRVVLTPGVGVVVEGRGIGLAHSLGSNPSPVDVVLTFGNERICVRFGGQVSFRPGTRFLAADAPPPAACPPL